MDVFAANHTKKSDPGLPWRSVGGIPVDGAMLDGLTRVQLRVGRHVVPPQIGGSP